MASPGKTLTRAELLIMEPPSTVDGKPGARLGRVQFQFNPNALSLNKSTEWRRKPSRMAESAGTPEFAGSGPRTLSLEMFLDATSDRRDSVEKNVETLMTACVPTTKSIRDKKPASPWVRFDWGSARTTSFDGVLTSFSVNYSLFDVDGMPLRARCSLSIEEAGGATPGQNPTSGAREATRTHRVVAGDSLELLAWQEYGDPTAWRRVALANDIDDPMVLTPGAELLVPGQDDVAELEPMESG